MSKDVVTFSNLSCNTNIRILGKKCVFWNWCLFTYSFTIFSVCELFKECLFCHSSCSLKLSWAPDEFLINILTLCSKSVVMLWAYEPLCKPFSGDKRCSGILNLENEIVEELSLKKVEKQLLLSWNNYAFSTSFPEVVDKLLSMVQLMLVTQYPAQFTLSIYKQDYLCQH